MTSINSQLKFFIIMARTQAIVTRKFDSKLLHGLSFNDFTILYYLSEASEERMRRTDLAEKMGVTASGITRILLPMEKIGLIKREAHKQDGRVSYVKITRAGKEFLTDTIETAENLSQEILGNTSAKKAEDMSKILSSLSLNQF